MKLTVKSILLAATILSAPAVALAQSGANPMVGGAEMSAEMNIVENAVNSADHTTLVAAVKAAGLVETLSGEGPFTVFAPTNAAFDKLPAGTVDTLLKPENKDQLTKVLTCHVVAANAMSDAIMGMIADDNGDHPVPTVGGCTLSAKMDGDNITLTDEQGNVATVTIADVRQSNGVIHVIDTVMLPAAEEASTDEATTEEPAMAADANPMVGGAEMFADRNIIENAVNSADHTTLVAAVKAAGLVETLSGEGPFTVFAPTNAAFDKLPAGTVDTLLKPENKDQLTKVLTCHVVAANAMSDAIMGMIADDDGDHPVPTVGGCTLSAKMDGDNITLTDEQGNVATVTIADVRQSNGVIHVIDTVMLPAAEEASTDEATTAEQAMGADGNPMVGGAEMFANKNIVENAVNSPIHTTLVAAVKQAGLVETLSGEGPFTVFAPTDDAFAALPEGTVDTLMMEENKDQLTKILTAHVIPGRLTAADLTAGLSGKAFNNFETVSGDALSVQLSPGGNAYVFDENGNAWEVTTADVMQSNGVIHVVGGVLLPR